MENTNILEGMKCPKCQSLSPMSIGVAAVVIASDEEIMSIDYPEWTDESSCQCAKCGYNGIVKDFK